MRVNYSFSTHISELRRLMIKRLIERILVATFLLSLIVITVALGIQKIGLFYWDGYSIYVFLVLISFAFSVLYALRTKRSLMDELIQIDFRLGMKERLSTAYEYHQLGRSSVFVDLLINEASNLLSLVKANQILPRKFSLVHLLIPLFATAIITLLSVDLTPTGPKLGKAGGKGLKEIGLKMDAFFERELHDSEKMKEKPPKDLYRHLEEIANELKDQSMTRQELLQSLGELTREAEIERMELARQLEAELSPGDISNTPMLKPLQKRNVTQNELKQLREQLEKLFEGEIPASLSRDISSLDQNLSLEAFLEKTMDEVRLGLPANGESDVLEEEGIFVGKASEEEDASNALGVFQSGEAGSLPGRERAEGKKKSPYELESSKGPALKDTGVSGQGEWYRIYVRSLPTIGQSRLKEKEVIKHYQQELEDVLQKEDIPLNYREYIKNYFLSIGLTRKQHGSGHTN